VNAPEVLERRQTADGELVLRRSGDDLELIMNGVFLMSTGNGASERELVRAVGPGGRLLIGGLGAGYSLAEAVAVPDVSEVIVVESEPDVIAWNRTYFRPYNQGAVDDPRVTVVHADMVAYLAGLTRLRELLRPDGRLAVWAAQDSPEFSDRLGSVFASTDVIRVPVARGPDDVIYVASDAAVTAG